MTSGYERRIGRYTRPLARALIEVAAVREGQRVLDVGCGTGALTAELAATVGAENVVGIDLSPAALAECARRLPAAELHQGRAERLPFAEDSFDAVLSQLMIGLLKDHPRAAAEMRRVARPGAPVTVCAWDFAQGMTVLRAFWEAAEAAGLSGTEDYDQALTHPYTSRDELHGLWQGAGLAEVESGELVIGAAYSDFDDLWEPLIVADGSPGRYYETLAEDQRAALRDELSRHLGSPEGSFELTARAWYARGVACG